MVLGQLDSHIQKNEVGLLLYTIYKNELKINQRPKCKAKTTKHLKENSVVHLHDLHGFGDGFLDMTPKA